MGCYTTQSANKSRREGGQQEALVALGEIHVAAVVAKGVRSA